MPSLMPPLWASMDQETKKPNQMPKLRKKARIYEIQAQRTLRKKTLRRDDRTTNKQNSTGQKEARALKNASNSGKKKKPNSEHYTIGEVNRLIDDIFHPLYKVNKGFVLVDGTLHFIAEKNVGLSTQKFVKYNTKTIIEEIRKLLG